MEDSPPLARDEAAEEYRRVVASYGSARSRAGDLIGWFGYDDLNDDAREAVTVRLGAAGLITHPPLSSPGVRGSTRLKIVSGENVGREGRTIGQVVAGMPATTASAAGGLALLAFGSIGPWATVLAVSVPGTRGDGKITLALAAVEALLLATRRSVAVALAGLAAVAAAAITGYDLVHIERAVNRATVLGASVASAGWGIYVALVGAIVTLLALGAEYARL